MVAHNYHTGARSFLPALAADVLAYCDDWRSANQICRRFNAYPDRVLRSLLALLTKRTFLESSNGRRASIDPFEEWREWMPEGAFFHFATKDVDYGEPAAIRRELARKARRTPPPSPVKRYPRARRTLLPAADDSSSLARVLHERRTWRRFGRGTPLTLDHMATLLGLTWGVQRWVQTPIGQVALKCSPSGGARHPIEVYVLARSIEGLSPGWYHYDADAHAVELVPRAALTPAAACFPQQPAYRFAPAVFVMAAVFARTRWAYRSARAYRVVLLDAGHLGQTFCLVATALGLAPFCSAALADSRIERDLRLDGIAESVVYACGVGARPRGVDWAPWPDRADLPRLSKPAWAKDPRRR